MPSWDLKPSAQLDESIAWFKKRLAISSKELEALKVNARRTGFWMAKVHTAKRAKNIQNSLEIALANGMPFDTWRRNNKSILRGITKAHLATTFQNWTQTSYNAARVSYLSNPQVVKRRPYWVFDATLDSVTTPVCRAYNGTVLPAMHPWFAAHTPPLHHNCRSSIRGLTFAQASKIGIRKNAPAARMTKSKAEGSIYDPGMRVSKADGFGNQASEPWSPSTKDLPKGFKLPKRPSEMVIK